MRASVFKAMTEGKVRAITHRLAVDERHQNLLDDESEFRREMELARQKQRWDTGALDGRLVDVFVQQNRKEKSVITDKFRKLVEEAKLDKGIIYPHSRIRRFFDYSVGSSLLVLAWFIPFDLGFDPIPQSESWDVFSYAMDILFVLNILTNFRTAYYDHVELVYVRDRKRIARRYLKFWFWIDVLSIIPYELLFGGSTAVSGKWLKASKWGKLPRLLRLGKLVRLDMNFAQNWHTIRVLLITMFAVHWFACALAGYMRDADAFPPEISEWTRDNLYSLYGVSFRTATMLVFGISTVDLGVKGEWILILTMILGAMCWAVLQGHIFSNVYFAVKMQTKYFNRVQSVMTEMEQLQLPPPLIERVKHYYTLLWKTQRSVYETLIYDDEHLSYELRKEIALHVNKDLILNTTVFRRCLDDCIASVLMRMRTHVYLEREFVVHRGDCGRDLHLIAKGSVSVLDPSDDASVLRYISRGQVFGEMALLSRRNQERRCSVITVSVCEIRVLRGCDFDSITADYPNFRENMAELAAQRSKEIAAEVRTLMNSNKKNEMAASQYTDSHRRKSVGFRQIVPLD